MPTSKGMIKLREMIDGYNDEINQIVNASTQTGAKISVNRLYQGLSKIKDEMKRTSDQPQVIDAAFRNVKKQWMEATSNSNGSWSDLES